MNRRSLTLCIIWTLCWFAIGYWGLLPTLSFSFGSGIYWFLIIYFAVLGVCMLNDGESKFSLPIWLVSAILLLIWIGIGSFGTAGMFHAEAYRALIGEVKESKFTADVAPINPEQMITVDKDIAIRIGGKVIGEQPGLGSRTELGGFTLQAVKGQLYWIAPLVHSGFFKWNRFGDDGTPGYVVVSATNQEDYRLVTDLNGQKMHIRYQEEAYFSQDLERHIYMHGYASKGFTDYNFEVDDNWKPYWTVTVYDSKVGFEGDDATAVLVIDPETGDIKEHSLTTIPGWIDRVQPVSFVQNQADDWGNFVHGWPNWSGNDKLSAGEDCSIVLGSDGKVYYYLGLTSKGNDNSTVGFMMVDARTKSVKWYHQSGATEEAARGSAEGKVQQMGYVGSDGITYNIDGVATYEFLLKDKAGLMKLISLVSVHDHTIVGVGENRQQAIRNYRTELASHGNAVSVGPSELDKKTLISTVNRMAADVSAGNTDYYFTLDARKENFFTGNTSVSVEIALTRPGDKVKVVFVENNRKEIEVQLFTNLTLALRPDSIEAALIKGTDSIRNEHYEKKVDDLIDKKWEQLSREEKREKLKKK